MDLSVIIPIYNHEDYIEQCLNSILEDFPENSEIIIIDDVCTDLSIEKIKKINSNKIKIYRNEKNMGCAYNLNKGIELAKGKYIGINYSDDFVETGFYKKMLDVAKSEDADVVCANIADYNEKAQKTIYNDITAGNIFYEVYKHNIQLMQNPFQVSASFLLGHWTASSASTKIIKKQFYEKYKFDGSKANDIPAIYPIMTDAKKIIYYPGLYLFYREVENSLSRASDIENYKSVGDSIVKAFQLMDDIENSNDKKEVLFFNNCLNYLLYVLNKIPDRDMRLECTTDYIKRLNIYDKNIFNSMKQSEFYNNFLANNKITESLYDLLQEEKIVDFIVEMEKCKVHQDYLQNLEKENIEKENLQLEIEKQRIYMSNLIQENENMKNKICNIKDAKKKLEKEIMDIKNERSALKKDNILLEKKLKDVANIKDNIVQAYENSLSWRVTKPMRKIRNIIKKK